MSNNEQGNTEVAIWYLDLLRTHDVMMDNILFIVEYEQYTTKFTKYTAQRTAYK